MTSPTGLKYLDEGSPVAAFVAWLHGLNAVNRAFAAGWHHADCYSTTFAQDVQMLLDEGVTIGLRTPYLRRVAVPLVMAQRELERVGSDGVAARQHVETAIEILGQLKEGDIKARCLEWIRRKWHVD